MLIYRGGGRLDKALLWEETSLKSIKRVVFAADKRGNGMMAVG
jgi:hypothetical protein